jgi:hypothetical protein
MKFFIGIYIFFFLSNSYAGSTPKDMATLCSVDDGQLKNISEFPRWTPTPGSALFVSFNNLTSRLSEPHKECYRTTSVSGNTFENKGDDCNFSVKETDVPPWTLQLKEMILGNIEIVNGVELTLFESGLAPIFGGSVWFTGDLTRLCRRSVDGTITDEIILEVQNTGGWFDYYILDEYPSNI